MNTGAQSPLDGFDPNADGSIFAVVVQSDGKIVIAGDFHALSPNGEPKSHDLEAALVANIQPGLYTARVRGKSDTSGIGVVQAYFLQEEASRLVRPLVDAETRLGTRREF